MAWNKFVTLITILVVLLPTIATAKEFIVGDDSGWKTNFDYQAWAKDKVFRVGRGGPTKAQGGAVAPPLAGKTIVVFNYKAPNHNVFKVNGTGFKECIKPTENEAPLSSGNDKIDLQTSGNKWYICSVKDHCDLGMKLFITVSDESSAVRGITLSGSYQTFMAVIMAITAIAALST